MNTFFAPIGSKIYREARENTVEKTLARQRMEDQPEDLEAVVEKGDKLLKRLPRWTYSFPIPEGIGVQFHDLYFPSPLTLAAFKDDLSIINIWMQLGLGGACIKTVMKEPRPGNERPRLQQVIVDGESCLLNAMGLPGHGIEGKIQEFEQSGIFDNGLPIGLSIGGNSVEEYQYVFDRLHRYMIGREIREQRPLPYYFEINISCPNTPEGQQMTKNPHLLEELGRYMRSKTTAVIGVKLSPDATNKQLIAFAEMLKQLRRTYVNLGNTTYRTCGALGLSPRAISIGGGGLSGPALFERTMEMVDIVGATGIAICATGGIDSTEKAQRVLNAGNDYNIPLIIGMATAVVKDMYCIPRINRALAKQRR